MAKTVEVFYTIQNGRPSIKFHIAEEVEGLAKEKFLELLKDLPLPDGVIDALSAVPPARLLPSSEVEVLDVPGQRPSNSKTQAFKSGNKQKITEGQLYCIKNSLARRQIPEEVFCQEQGVERLEDISKNAAIKIVSEIKNKNL